MRFLVDANLPRTTIALLKSSGHEAEDVRDLGMGHAPDPQISAYAKASGAILLTRDLDFSDIRTYSPSEHPGLAVIRLPDHATARFILEILQRFLRRETLVVKIPGHLVIIEEDRVRFRPALEE